MTEAPLDRSLVDELVDQLQAFRADGDELAALRAVGLIAEIPSAEWPELAERAAAAEVTRVLAALADLGARVAKGASALPDAYGWRAVARAVR